MAKNVINVKILGDNKDLRSKLSDSESKLAKFGGNAAKLVGAGALAAGTAVAVAMTKGFSDALGAEAGVDKLQASLGISEEDAAALGSAASSVYRDAWGGSLAEVQGFVGNLSTSFDDLGADQVEGLTANAIALGDAFGIDTAAGIQTASELVTSGLASSAEDAFDLLTVGLQKMPAGIRDELLEASNEYGDFFADLGISGDEAFSLLTNAAADGTYGIDKTGDAIKELSIRATDMSASSNAAFMAAGLDAESMAAAFLEGGETARGAMDTTIEGLLSIEDPVEQANAAVALFGTPLEDLSVSEIPDFLDSLSDMGGGLGDVEGAAQEMSDTLAGNSAATIESFKRKALGALADFAADKLLPAFEKFVGFMQREVPPVVAAVTAKFEEVKRKVMPTLEALVDWFRVKIPPALATARDAFDEIKAAVSTAFDWMIQNRDLVLGAVVALGVAIATILVPPLLASAAASIAAAAPFIALAVLIAALGAAVVYAYQEFGWFRIAVDKARELVEKGFKVALEVGKKAVDAIWSAIKTASEWLQAAWTKTENLRSMMATGFSNALGVARTAVDKAWSAIQTAADWLQTAWDKSETLRSLYAAGFKTAVDLVKIAFDAWWSAVKTAGEWLQTAWDKSDKLRSLMSVGFKLAIDGVKKSFDNTKTAVELVAGWLQTAWNKSDTLRSLFAGGFKTSVDNIKKGFDFAKTAAESLATAIQKVINNAGKAVSAIQKIPGVPGGGGFDIPGLPFFHSGGFVGNAAGPPRDIPIMAQQGEYVLSRDDVAALSGGRAGGAPVVINLMDRFQVDAIVSQRDADLLRSLEGGLR